MLSYRARALARNRRWSMARPCYQACCRPPRPRRLKISFRRQS